MKYFFEKFENASNEIEFGMMVDFDNLYLK